MDARAVNDLRELAREDGELSAEASRLRDLDAQVAAVRARAEAIDAFFAGYPEEEGNRREAVTAAESELERRRRELHEAERELDAAADGEAHERAQHAVERARDHVAVADASLGRARAAADELERDAQSLPEELSLLEARAAAIAREAADVPEAQPGARGLVEWASHAHAELFVGAGQLDARRERVIREANELATMMLGEPTYGSTVAQALARVVRLHEER